MAVGFTLFVYVYPVFNWVAVIWQQRKGTGIVIPKMAVRRRVGSNKSKQRRRKTNHLSEQCEPNVIQGIVTCANYFLINGIKLACGHLSVEFIVSFTPWYLLLGTTKSHQKVLFLDNPLFSTNTFDNPIRRPRLYMSYMRKKRCHSRDFCDNSWNGIRVATTGLILGLRPANKRRRYCVKTSLIGWHKSRITTESAIVIGGTALQVAIATTSGTGGCLYDNLRCHQFRLGWHHEWVGACSRDGPRSLQDFFKYALHK